MKKCTLIFFFLILEVINLNGEPLRGKAFIANVPAISANEPIEIASNSQILSKEDGAFVHYDSSEEERERGYSAPKVYQSSQKEENSIISGFSPYPRNYQRRKRTPMRYTTYRRYPQRRRSRKNRLFSTKNKLKYGYRRPYGRRARFYPKYRPLVYRRFPARTSNERAVYKRIRQRVGRSDFENQELENPRQIGISDFRYPEKKPQIWEVSTEGDQTGFLNSYLHGLSQISEPSLSINYPEFFGSNGMSWIYRGSCYGRIYGCHGINGVPSFESSSDGEIVTDDSSESTIEDKSTHESEDLEKIEENESKAIHEIMVNHNSGNSKEDGSTSEKDNSEKFPGNESDADDEIKIDVDPEYIISVFGMTENENTEKQTENESSEDDEMKIHHNQELPNGEQETTEKNAGDANRNDDEISNFDRLICAQGLGKCKDGAISHEDRNKSDQEEDIKAKFQDEDVVFAVDSYIPSNIPATDNPEETTVSVPSFTDMPELFYYVDVQ